MKHILIIICLISGISLKGVSQQAAPDSQRYNFTIQDCIEYAYIHQHDVMNANLDVNSAEYYLKETTGQGLPQISATANFLDYVQVPTTLVPGEIFGQPGRDVKLKFGVTYQSTVGINASQILFDPNYFIGLQARRTYKELYVRTFTRSKIDASVNVTKAYFQVLVSVEQLKLLDANIKEIKQQLDETVARNKQGFVEKIDVDRLTVQYNTLITNRENTLRLLALNYQLLKFQMGMPVDASLTLKNKLEDIKLSEDIADALQDTAVYHNRIEYSLLESQKSYMIMTLNGRRASFCQN